MSDDLVKALRSDVYYMQRRFGVSADLTAISKAADRIEALEAQLAEADARAIRLAEEVLGRAATQANKLASHYEQLAKNQLNDEARDRLHARSQAVINIYIAIRAIHPRALMEQMKEEE